MDLVEEIMKHISYCFLPKLSRNFEEIDNHPEYFDRKKNLDTHFPPLLDLITNGDVKNHPDFSRRIMPSLLRLYFERSAISPWNTDKSLEYTRNLNRKFQSTYHLTLENVLLVNGFCDVQIVFDNILREFNLKVTSRNFKKYPGCIMSYYLIMKSLKDYKVSCNPVTLFPICLLLIEDYVPANRTHGLRCCSAMLQCLEEKHFQLGNYYDVIYSSLKKVITLKKNDDIMLVHECLLELIRLLPSDEKKSKTDEIFGIMLEQIHMESNLHRKTTCLCFIKHIIMIHKENCVNKKLLKTVLFENVYICCNDAVADIMLVELLQTLRVWIKHCWCVWRFPTDHKLLSGLIKLLYVSRKEKIASEIQELLVSFISLCSKGEQIIIQNNLLQSEIPSPEFHELLEKIKRDISI